MYDLEYLPAAMRDMAEIIKYISQELHNPIAASRLAGELIEAGKDIAHFPYSAPVHMLIRPLKYEYRKKLVQHYLIFYWVNEKKRLVTIARVIYAKRNYGRLFD